MVDSQTKSHTASLTDILIGYKAGYIQLQLGMNEMSTQGLLERSNGYYFQARIPKKYASHFPQYPSKIIREKLLTDNRKEAVAMVRKKWAELQGQFERIDSSGNKSKTTISSSESEYIIKLALHTRLKADEGIRAKGIDDDTYQRLENYYIENDTDERLAVSRGQFTQLAIEKVSDWLRGHGYDIKPNTTEFREFAHKFIKSQIAATRAIQLRNEGNPIETPPAPPKESLSNTIETNWDSLDKLREYWLLQPAKSSGGKKSRTSIAEAITIIKKFKTLVGDLKPSEVTRSHVADLKDKMLEAGSAPATINKGRGILAAIFSTAESNGKLDKNPFLEMEKLPVQRGEVERPYNIDELQTIFNSPIYTKGKRPKRFQGDSAYWIPLLALYSGARLNELGQIFTEDVGIEDDVNFFMIKPDSKTDRTVKDGKRRRVPVHPELIKMGFLAYCTKIKGAGHQQLFPELKITRVNGKLADKWGDWWRDYVRKDLGIIRIPQPTHGFRHTFIAHCRRCKVDSEHRRIIEGHVPNSIDMRNYDTGGFPLVPLYEELQKLTYNGLDLTHLYMATS